MQRMGDHRWNGRIHQSIIASAAKWWHLLVRWAATRRKDAIPTTSLVAHELTPGAEIARLLAAAAAAGCSRPQTTAVFSGVHVWRFSTHNLVRRLTASFDTSSLSCDAGAFCCWNTGSNARNNVAILNVSPIIKISRTAGSVRHEVCCGWYTQTPSNIHVNDVM